MLATLPLSIQTLPAAAATGPTAGSAGSPGFARLLGDAAQAQQKPPPAATQPPTRPPEEDKSSDGSATLEGRNSRPQPAPPATEGRSSGPTLRSRAGLVPSPGGAARAATPEATAAAAAAAAKAAAERRVDGAATEPAASAAADTAAGSAASSASTAPATSDVNALLAEMRAALPQPAPPPQQPQPSPMPTPLVLPPSLIDAPQTPAPPLVDPGTADEVGMAPIAPIAGLVGANTAPGIARAILPEDKVPTDTAGTGTLAALAAQGGQTRQAGPIGQDLPSGPTARGGPSATAAGSAAAANASIHAAANAAATADNTTASSSARAAAGEAFGAGFAGSVSAALAEAHAQSTAASSVGPAAQSAHATGALASVNVAALQASHGVLSAQAAPSTAPSAEAQLSARPGSADFAPQLGAQITTFARNGVEHARLHLNPADMGPVMVQIQLDGQAAQVHMSADHAATRQALEQAMPALASGLREAGLTLAGGGVFEQPQQAQDQAQGDTQRGAASARANGHNQGAIDAAQAEARNNTPTLRRRGVVDLVA